MLMNTKNKKILIIIGGGISAYKSLDLIRLLRKDSYEIKIVLTKGGKQFVTPLSITSLTNNKIRKDVAMTGEITLRGRVLPIGGLKEKSTAALRAGLSHIIVPHENSKELEENPELVEIPVAHALIAMGYVEEKRDKSICSAMARHFQSLGWTPTNQRSRYQLPNGSRSDKTTGWCRPRSSSIPF